MTTPAPPYLGTGSFSGVLTPAQVSQLLNALIEGAPFAASLTRAPTATGKMAFPVVGPTGYAWTEEMGPVPSLLLNDKALIVSVAKIIGALPISAEMQYDASVNITSWVTGALSESLSRDLDLGLLRGTGHPEPDGIIDQAEAGIRADAHRGGQCRHRGHRRGGRLGQHDRAVAHRVRR